MEISYRTIQENDILSQKKAILKLFELLFFEKEVNERKKISQMYYENMYNFCKDGSAILLGAFCENLLIGFHWAYEINWGGREEYTVIS